MTKKARRRPSLDELRAELKRLHSRKARRRWLASLLIVLALALSVGSYLSSTRFVLMRVSGEGMENALQAGDVVLCQRNARVMRGDIIAFEREGALLIKRVIAMEGDQVSIGFEGKVSINGVEIEEGYLSSEGPGSGDVVYPVVVPAGRVFVMGDNRNVSVDSRNSSIGMLPLEEVIGCVKALVWPTERIRWI